MAPRKLKIAGQPSDSKKDGSEIATDFTGADHAEGVFILDGRGKILGVNGGACALFGFEVDALTGENIGSLLANLEGGFSAFLGFEPKEDFEEPYSHTLVCRRKDGFAMVMDVRITRLNGSGPGCFAAILRYEDMDDEDTESRLAGFTSNIPGIVFQRVQQPDGDIYYPFLSGGVEDILGFPPDDMRVNSDGCLDVVHWADRDQLMKTIRQSAEDVSPFSEEFRAITKGGEVKWLSGLTRPQSMPNGDIMWDGVLLDITERKLAEQRLEMIMDHAYDSIITISEDGIIESVNGAAERLFGYRESELTGQNVKILMDDPHQSAHDGYLKRYLETGEPHLLGAGPVEVLGRKQDGSQVPIELALSEVRMEGRRIFISVARDITQRKENAARLRETEQRLLGIASNMPGIVFQRIMRPDGLPEFTYISDASLEILEISPETLLEDSDLFLETLEKDSLETFLKKFRASAKTLKTMTNQFKVKTRSGKTRWLSAWSRPRKMEDGNIVWDGVMLDITSQKQAENRLTYLAYFDPITKLPNREKFLEYFDTTRAAADKMKKSVAVLSLGLDRFGIINASMGHTVGDQVLSAAAGRLSRCIGETNTVARTSGDRFLVLIGNMMADVELVDTIDSIIRRFQKPLIVEGQEFDLTVSIGASMYPRDGEDAETLIKNADAALNRAKSQGPGSVQLYTAEMGERANKTLTMQVRLRKAIENQEIVAYYQPQVDLRTGATIGMEALARWEDSDTGKLIPPVEFIPVAEEYGLIEAISEIMLMETCRTNKAWQDAGIAMVPAAVNLSGRQFHNSRKLMSSVENVIKETGIDPKYLELELTESSAMSDPENAIAVIRSLRDRGISCAIDDFGTGYSSLSWLKRFPIRKLKIDRSFVMDVITDPNDAAIVGALVAMSHALKLKVIAEGVEDMRQYDFLRKLGCDQIQGYLVSRPLPAKEMEAFFQEGKWKPIKSV